MGNNVSRGRAVVGTGTDRYCYLVMRDMSSGEKWLISLVAALVAGLIFSPFVSSFIGKYLGGVYKRVTGERTLTSNWLWMVSSILVLLLVRILLS